MGRLCSSCVFVFSYCLLCRDKLRMVFALALKVRLQTADSRRYGEMDQRVRGLRGLYVRGVYVASHVAQLMMNQTLRFAT